MVSLPPGAYTALVNGVAGGTGVTVLAVYEVAQPEVPLVNLSTRATVTEDVVIGGFVIQGNTPKTVVIHGTGPSLAPYGIANPLGNPLITLIRSSDQAVITSNDDWQGAPNAAQIQAAGFAPSHPLESAIMITLNPGAYTVILQGVGGGQGIGVFAVYGL
jgi:hypothetical protein